jgi:hypothetical protein
MLKKKNFCLKSFIVHKCFVDLGRFSYRLFSSFHLQVSIYHLVFLEKLSMTDKKQNERRRNAAKLFLYYHI